MKELEDRIKQLEERLEQALQENQRLKARIEELEEKLNTNSKNSSKPPSQDPYRGRRSKAFGSAKKQGGQPGRKGVWRKLFQKEEVSEIIEINPQNLPWMQRKSFQRISHKNGDKASDRPARNQTYCNRIPH